jgi:hypothetical protein
LLKCHIQSKFRHMMSHHILGATDGVKRRHSKRG